MTRRSADCCVTQTVAHGCQLANGAVELVRLVRQQLPVNLRTAVGCQHVADLIQRKSRRASQRDQRQYQCEDAKLDELHRQQLARARAQHAQDHGVVEPRGAGGRDRAQQNRYTCDTCPRISRAWVRRGPTSIIELDGKSRTRSRSSPPAAVPSGSDTVAARL